MDRVYEPWPDDEQDPTNVEEWGWWDETPHRLAIDGPNALGNVPTSLFEIMWERNPANQRDFQDDNSVDCPPEETYGRWLMWDDRAIADEEMRIALNLAASRVV